MLISGWSGPEPPAAGRPPGGDWPPVALGFALEAGTLTADRVFLGLGCGRPTWTVETLQRESGEPDRPELESGWIRVETNPDDRRPPRMVSDPTG